MERHVKRWPATTGCSYRCLLTPQHCSRWWPTLPAWSGQRVFDQWLQVVVITNVIHYEIVLILASVQEITKQIQLWIIIVINDEYNYWLMIKSTCILSVSHQQLDSWDTEDRMWRMGWNVSSVWPDPWEAMMVEIQISQVTVFTSKRKDGSSSATHFCELWMLILNSVWVDEQFLSSHPMGI